QTIPDEQSRTAELYNFYSVREKYEEAQKYLDELEKKKPDDVDILQQQFLLSIRGSKFDRAKDYVSKLSQRNADGVGGAQIRGQFELAKNNPEGAINEFRAAERELPTDAVLKVRLAQALLATSPPRYEEAIQSLKQALDFQPRNFMANK